HVHRLVELADAGINSHLSEQRLHAESASFIRNDRNNQLADFRVTQELRQHSDEHHGRRNFSPLCALVKLFELGFRHMLDQLGTDLPLGHVTAQLFTPFLHVSKLTAVVWRTVKGRLMKLIVRNWNTESRAEHPQLVFVQLLLLVSNILTFTRFSET